MTRRRYVDVREQAAVNATQLMRSPKPCPRPAACQPAFARPHHVTSVTVAMTEISGPAFRYHAACQQRSWSGVSDSPTGEAAVLDAVQHVLSDSDDLGRIRFAVDFAYKSPLWREIDQINELLNGPWIEKYHDSDRSLMRAAHAAVTAAVSANELPTVQVATDGSVYRDFCGCGWLADSGEYGLRGHQNNKQLTTHKSVLAAELLAIKYAIEQLPRRRIYVFSDSKLAVNVAQWWMAGNKGLPNRYRDANAHSYGPRLIDAQPAIRDNSRRITITWRKGHRGEPLNEGADSLAKLARRYSVGHTGLSEDSYLGRAAELAEAFSAEFRRRRGTSGML